MALRVTQNMMYSSFTNNINRTTAALMESNQQETTQKRVNRPSDDPVSAGRILNTRATLSTLAIYEENISMAKGWLSLMDSVLGSGTGSVQSVLTRIKELALSGSDGAKTAENRLQISYELREQFEQLLNLANSEYAGNHIFAGHKTDRPAYKEGVAITALDSNDPPTPTPPLTSARFNATGNADRTIVLQPINSGDANTVDYRYSTDGGTTWQAVESVTTLNGVCTIKASGSSFSFDVEDENGNAYQVTGVEPLGVTDKGPENVNSNNNGTWLYIRPTAIYQGDDHSSQVVSGYKPAGANPALKGDADGNFSRDVIIRLDKIENGKLYYSFSADNGSNWSQTSAPQPTTAPFSLTVPGGFLNMSGGVPTAADMGSQYVIHPHRAEIDYQIGQESYITVNMVGKDIFGGLYDYPEDGIDYPTTVTGQANLFEVVGNLIAAAETNSQQGMQEGLDALTEVMNVVLTRAAEAGGRTNRLTTTENALLIRQYSEEDLLSTIEDVNPFELSTRLAQQQTILNSVLKSSSMIMQMSLVNFL